MLKAKIFYPFPVDEFHNYPDSISIEKFNYIQTDSGVYFTMRFRPQAIETLRVFYRQSLKRNQCRYILTTTKYWRNVLEQADFIIDVAVNLEDVQLSYRADSVIFRDNRRYYYLSKKKFMPEKDLIVKWQTYQK
ncbi:MAG: hypothetical protein ABIK61_00145 [candidate division WOR-3 bacterium]